ncbi:MAG: sarcosine oxidase, subunit alpha [Solirubrobacterales bacterium]|jgi:sarcosine oxidase subunit alpha|nr:sarcosine oxidase, subunit alpha [Solirubrobacterales bacterium]
MTRLPANDGQRIDSSRKLRFSFDGKDRYGFAGDTIASALYADGQRVFSRSFKYHRPRGEICGCGQCANSLVTVNGAPGVRACAEPLRDKLVVEHQNAWPSLRFDVMNATDRFAGPLTPPGFYYKTFIRPRRLWPVYEKVLRSAAGLGRLKKRQSERVWRTEYRRRHCDVLVVGGGVAGLSAALRAASLGADVVLCDDDVEPGGAMLSEGDHARARDLTAACHEHGVEILSRASALGYFDGIVAVWQGDTLHQIRAERHVTATGAIEQPLVFPNNDLPGVMLSGGALRLAALYGVSPGSGCVVATTEDRGLRAALSLHELGVNVAAVADLRPDQDGELSAALERAGIEVLRGMAPVRAEGRGALKGVKLAAIDASGRSRDGGREIPCDVLAVCGGAAPASSLLLQAGARARYDEASCRFLPGELPAGVFAAGAVAGDEDLAVAELSGMVAGAEAALDLGLGDAAARETLEGERRRKAELAATPARIAPPALAHDGNTRGKAFVDLDEDITAKDVRYAADEGYDSIELSKRYTTVTMGPSQGRFSQLASIRVLAEETGLALGEVGLTTARPPWTTVPLGALAGRPFEAAKRSAIHARHRRQGATVQWAGDWRRAYDYGDPEGEALAVQSDAGLIDVSTLGKLIVRGADAGEFLDRLYPNRMSTLKPGRIRYGVLTSEAGRISDDGTVCRLDDETFYVTTTSSGAGAVEQWFSWWLADWDDLDVSLTDVTQGVAAMNLAGPKAREILTQLTALDCSNDAFPYLDGQQAEVAGAPCLLLRIGFVGELGYELHCPAPQALGLWDAICELGARPFGLEPQRILRLQKMHILVGQDTDSESTPYGAAMDWVVKLDKEQDFIGRWALEDHAEREPPTKLVGFTCPGGEVPTEGAAVIDAAGAATGQVTSSRRSPKLRQAIGLAQVLPSDAEDGTQITISDGGSRIAATVTTKPFYDPEGEVLRS